MIHYTPPIRDWGKKHIQELNMYNCMYSLSQFGLNSFKALLAFIEAPIEINCRYFSHL